MARTRGLESLRKSILQLTKLTRMEEPHSSHKILIFLIPLSKVMSMVGYDRSNDRTCST